MKRLIPALFAPFLLCTCSGSPEATPAPTMVEPAEAFPVPFTPTVDVVDNYFDVQIADPYRWLEDQDGEDTAMWVQEQNAVTNAYLGGIPQREGIRQRLTELWNYPRYSPPERAGERWIYGKNDGLQNQAVLYVTDNPMEDGEVLLDPNGFSADGTVALSGWELSKNGRYLAFSTSASGSDWREWHVLDMASGDQLEDVVRWSKFAGVAWTPDEAGFFYQRFPTPLEGETFEAVNEKPQLCYHELGTDPAEDVVVYERPDEPRWMFGPVVTEDGRYLVIHLSAGTDPKNRVVYASLGDGIGPVQPLLMDFDAMYSFLGSNADVFYFQTDNLAPLGRVIALDIHKPKPEPVAEPEVTEVTEITEVTEVTEEAQTEMVEDEEADIVEWWDTVVPEAVETLEGARILANRLVLTYLADASSRVLVHALDGTPERELLLPGMGSTGSFTGKQSDQETFFTFTSFTTPSTILRYDFAEAQLSVFREPELRFDPEDFEVRRVFHSVEGTRVPLFLVHKKGIVLDGSNPTLLYGYGGFNISMTPRFSVSNLVWVEMGGIYAHAILRGGGEYGEAWHLDGIEHNKQNVFDDFIGHAEYLLRNQYTSSSKLAIVGSSNGGLLVGAVLTQRPELFGAAVPQVGVMDMLRFQKFTIGWAWVSEYGSSDDETMFPFLLAYSPLHNLQIGRSYPPTLVMTGDHDDRVLPGHSYKFAATIQRAQGGTAPILIRVDTNTGHGGGKPTDKQIDEAADRLAFLVKALDMR